MKKVCIFCGSSYGTEKVFQEKTISLGKSLVKREIGLIYGGAKIGLMDTIADSVLESGGKVIGVIAEFLQDKEIAHENLTEFSRQA